MPAWVRQLCQPARGILTTATIRTTMSELPATANRNLQTAASASTATRQPPSPEDPHHYTTGRWLHNDQLQREARYVNFDFTALCQKAVNVCAGVTKVVRYEKKEGGFNRVFVLFLDNGSRVIARVPYRIAGPRRLATNSEVATMAFVRSFTTTPIPKVLDWSDEDNSVGTEYIIMEHAPGVQLHGKWSSMNPHQHILCVKNVSFAVAEMAKLPFPAYGSLYFADAPIDLKSKIEFAEGFCIGPCCNTQYWDCNVTEPRFYEERLPNRGPWTNLQSYCSGLIDAGFSRIPKTYNLMEELPYRGSVQEHLRLLDISREVINDLATSSIIQKVAGATLLHPDLHKRNIFVSEDDPSHVTAIIDWQSTCIEPAFVYANETPYLVGDPRADILILEKLRSSGDNGTAESSKGILVESPEEETARKKREKDVLTCQKTFDVVLSGYARQLYDARAMNQTLLRPFRYCNRSWRDGAAALRQELICLSQHWTDLGLSGSCKYQPTPEELAEHTEQYEDFETVQLSKIFLKRALDVNSDGWVPADMWETSKEEHINLLSQWMESVRDSGGSEDQAKKFWPFNETDA